MCLFPIVNVYRSVLLRADALQGGAARPICMRYAYLDGFPGKVCRFPIGLAALGRPRPVLPSSTCCAEARLERARWLRLFSPLCACSRVGPLPLFAPQCASA